MNLICVLVSEIKQARLSALRARPRKRPDWGVLMKEVEGAAKGLKHVQCNDRSSPILPDTRIKNHVSSTNKYIYCNIQYIVYFSEIDVNEENLEIKKFFCWQFLYESEKSNVHNVLLKQIESGVALKHVQCNDRSKPKLDGKYICLYLLKY